jgi:hypothetical protein
MKQCLSLASALLLALASSSAAQTLGEVSAAMGAHHSAAAAGSGSASTARHARETVTRHLPKPGAKLDGGGGRNGCGAMRTARAGHGKRGSWSRPGKGGGGGRGSWAGAGSGRRKGR